MAKKASSGRKMFSFRIVNKALHTLDKAAMAIVLTSWGGALAIMLFALYTLTLSMSAQKDVIDASTKEPFLPKIASRPPDYKEMEPLINRLSKRFPDISFALAQDRKVTVSAATGDKFRTWLTALSYIDTISPALRWHIEDLCVGGGCASPSPMQAVLRAEKISFTPASDVQ